MRMLRLHSGDGELRLIPAYRVWMVTPTDGRDPEWNSKVHLESFPHPVYVRESPDEIQAMLEAPDAE